MFFKVSNTAKMEEVREKFELSFKYPGLYSERIVINGLGEDNLCIVTNEDPKEVQIAIWGLMPMNYGGEWSTFQNITNTLNLSQELVSNTQWLNRLLKKRRCLILVTGFFTYFKKRNKIYPYYVSLASDEPFYLGGIYSRLQDSFLSCGILTTKLKKPLSNFHNINNQMPLAIPESIASEWLSDDFSVKDIENIIKNPPRFQFSAHPVAKEFFENNIIYESILQPAYYQDVLADEFDDE